MARSRCSTSGKDKFPSQLEADLALCDIMKSAAHHRKHKYRELPTRSYHCDSCQSWHMTSK